MPSNLTGGSLMHSWHRRGATAAPWGTVFEPDPLMILRPPAHWMSSSRRRRRPG